MKVKNSLKTLFSLALATILLSNTFFTIPAFAKVSLPTGRETEFTENDILFYNPDASPLQSRCRRTGTGNCNFIGNSYAERMWSGLRNYGFSPEQAAGLMGNFLHEGSTPVRQEAAYIAARSQGCKTQEGKEYTIWLDHATQGPAHHAECMWRIMNSGNTYRPGTEVAGIGIGFAQWTSHGKRVGYLSRMSEAGYIDYFDGDAYKKWGSIGSDDEFRQLVISTTGSDDDWKSIWCVALGYIYDEFSTQPSFLAQLTPEDVAGWVAANYEKCSTCSVFNTGWVNRRTSATNIYLRYLAGDFNEAESHIGEDNMNNPSQTNASFSRKNETGINITLIGDSVAESAKSEIQALYPEITDFDTAAGRTFDDGVSLASNKTLKEIIVFALGSNNEFISEDKANELLSLANDRILVFITNYSRGNKDFTANNALLKTIAASHTNVILADWAASVSTDPDKYIRVDSNGTDFIPTSGDGAKKYAAVLQEAISNGGTKASNLLDCGYDGGSGYIVDGGFSTVEEADAAIMAPYRAITPRDFGTSTEGDKILKSYHIYNVSDCYSDLENCPAFVAYFITKYINGVDLGEGLPDGNKVTETLIKHFGFSDEGTTPKVYAVFSTIPSYGNHTGVVLGINKEKDEIIIGQAGCRGKLNEYTKAKKEVLSAYSNGNYKYAYRDVNL